ncbi:hypothetical protein GGG16DRAFT_104901 [Schizophyllum commune]
MDGDGQPDPSKDTAQCFTAEATNGDHGCRTSFPYKDYPGRCARCAHVALLQREEPVSKAKISDCLETPQCRGCGAISMAFMKTGQCGSCRKRDAEMNGDLVDGALSAPSQHPSADDYPRVSAFNSRMGLGKQRAAHLAASGTIWTNAGHSPTSGPQASQPMTTDNLRALKASSSSSRSASSSSGSARIAAVSIAIIYMANGKPIMHTLGNSITSYTANTPFDQIHKDHLNEANSKWLRAGASAKITQPETFLSFCGNTSIKEEYIHGEVGALWDHYRGLPNADVYLNNGKVPSHLRVTRNQRQTRLVLEFHILVKDYCNRTKSDAPFELAVYQGKGKGRGKRARSPSTHPSSVPSSSVVRRLGKGSRIPSSRMFPLKKRVPVSNEPDNVQLEVAQIKISEKSCEYTIEWGHSKAKAATIEVAHFAQGATKRAYHANVAGKDCTHSFVLKRFFNIGNGAESVTIQENANFLVSEAMRLYTLRNVVADFNQKVDDEVASDQRDEVALSGLAFNVTPFFLVREVVTDKQHPSKASNTTYDEFRDANLDASDEVNVVWLMEPHHAQPVTKWSGTLSHPVNNSLVGQTARAIAHWFFIHTEYASVLADMQSVETLNQDTKELVNLLFDPMTHTANQEDPNYSGLGDFGQRGVDVFVKEHVCGNVCQLLKFDSISENAVEEEAAEVDSKDDD